MLRDKFVVYGKHENLCKMRYWDGKPIEDLITSCDTKNEALFIARDMQNDGWYDMRIVAHVGPGSPQELADLFRQSVKV